jgi:hypothetical protein
MTAQSIIGKCSPVRAAKWWPKMSREMRRAGVNIGKRSLESQPKAGSISTSSGPQAANRPNIGGFLRIETDLAGGSWISTPWKKTSGTQWLSLKGMIGTRGGHRRAQVSRTPSRFTQADVARTIPAIEVGRA